MIINRKQFREHWENVMPGLGECGSALWVPEQETGKKSRWFITVPPIQYDNLAIWIVKNCTGQVLCYSSDDFSQIEWWGFSHKPDIVWFRLKWS